MDAKLLKVRLAFEGPKKPAKKATTDDNSKDKSDNSPTNAGENVESKNGTKKKEEHFLPAATKKQLEAAKKVQQKANDAYEKGIRKLVARMEPVGYERNFNGTSWICS